MSRATELLEQATPLPWGVTTYAGGFSFNGPERLYAGTDPEFGEPRPVGTDADRDLIVYAVNHLPDYEAAVEALERLINVGDALWEDHPPVWMAEADDARAVLARLREGEAVAPGPVR